MTIDDLLRETVHGLAHQARTTADLATGAMVRGRRLRHRRRAGLTAAAVTLVGVSAIPYVVLHDRPGPVPATATVPATGPGAWWDEPVPLPGGWVVTGFHRDAGMSGARMASLTLAGTMVLDRGSGRYRAVPDVQDAWPAPRGTMVAITDNDRHVDEIGLLDAASGRTDWLDRPGVFEPQWSPDGRRLLFTTDNGFALIDVTTRRMTSHSVNRTRYGCTGCDFTWQPDGAHVGLLVDDPAAPELPEGSFDVPARKGVQVFAADTGRPTKFLPLRGHFVSISAWSPGGRYVLLDQTHQGEQQIVEVASGKVVRAFLSLSEFEALYFVDDNRLLSIRAGTASLIAIDTEKVLQQVPLPAGFGARTVSAGAG